MTSSTQGNLDYLRGLAALMVLFNHVRGSFYAGGERVLANDPSTLDYLSVAVLQLTSFGTEAVILFFVLSGFAMANSVHLSSSTVRFYMKRVVRIWPPYIAACLFAAAIGWGVGVEYHLLPKLLYINPGRNPLTPQFWSLPYEVLFYALCPLILSSRERVHWVFGFSSLAFVGTAIFGGLAINPWSSFVLDFIGNEMFLFACGAMAFHHQDRIPRVPRLVFVASVALALAVAWVTRRWIGEVNTFSIVAICAVSVLAIVNVRVIPKLNFGFFSYSLYLFHYALVVALSAMLLRFGIVASDTTNPLAWLPVAGAVAVCCFALYLVTERVCNQWVALIRLGSNRLDDREVEHQRLGKRPSRDVAKLDAA